MTDPNETPPPEFPHRTAKRVDRILEEAVDRDLSSWERYEFLPNIRGFRALSEKQETVLRRIERKLFGREPD